MAIAAHAKLADALTAAKRVAHGQIVRHSDLSRSHRSILLEHGFITDIIRGWYLLTLPQEKPEDTTVVQGAFWDFARLYLHHRFGDEYCLSAESSLDLWVDATQVPKQIIVIAGRGGSSCVKVEKLATSILTYTDVNKLPAQVERKNGLIVMPLAVALSRVTPRYFKASPLDAELALKMAQTSDISRALLQSANVAAAQRLVGAYERMAMKERAEQLSRDMISAGFKLGPATNPFPEGKKFLPPNEIIRSPHTGRIRAMWQGMRTVVLENFSAAPTSPISEKTYFEQLEDIYPRDAYNSLSIEGYQVTPELIERVRSGLWNPDNPEDARIKDALAAKGYHEAFKEVKKSIHEMFQGTSPGVVIDRDLQNWYRALFSPSVVAGIVSSSSLAGYRAGPVYIRSSRHVPPPREAVSDLMETFFELLKGEENAAVRAVLGHFIFVFIHPYLDGNGRIARFLMNTMWASGNYSWTVVRLSQRKRYLASLEKASVDGDIADFTRFLANEMNVPENSSEPASQTELTG